MLGVVNLNDCEVLEYRYRDKKYRGTFFSIFYCTEIQLKKSTLYRYLLHFHKEKIPVLFYILRTILISKFVERKIKNLQKWLKLWDIYISYKNGTNVFAVTLLSLSRKFVLYWIKVLKSTEKYRKVPVSCIFWMCLKSIFTGTEILIFKKYRTGILGTF